MSQLFSHRNCKSREFVYSFIHLSVCLFVHFRLAFSNHLYQTKSNVKEMNKKIMIATGKKEL